MTEFASVEPAYISRLALRSAPFTSNITPELYFGGGQAEQSLNLALHLVRASNKIGILCAKDGLGKTTALTQLKQRSGDEVRICSISASASVNTEMILEHCLRELGLEENDLRSSSDNEALRTRLKQLRKLNIRPLLLVDDGHKLPATVFTDIATWLSWKDENDYLLQAIFTTNNELIFPADVQPRIQIIDLPALSEQELANYVSYRLASAGYSGENLFSTKDLANIYRQSLGNPALINQLAHQQLLGLKQGLTKSPDARFLSLRFGLRWAGAAILVICLAWLLIYQDRINEWFTIESDNLDMTEQAVVEFQDQDIATVVVENDQPVSNEQANRDELEELLAKIPPQSEANQPALNEDIVSALPISTVEESNSQTAEVYQQDWVVQQQGSHYTFQLMGSWEKQEVDNFIEKYALSGDVAMLETMRNGRLWYVLIYGVFNTKQAALDASSEWPAPLNTLPSWLRRFDSVQKQIKNTAPAQQSKP